MPDAQPQEKSLSTAQADKLAGMVMRRFFSAANYRHHLKPFQGRSVDQWLRTMWLAYRKQHDYDDPRTDPNSVSYFGLVQQKADLVVAGLRALLINGVDAPVTLEPSPDPELPKDIRDQLHIEVARTMKAQLIAARIPRGAIFQGPGRLDPVIAAWMDRFGESIMDRFKAQAVKELKKRTAKHELILRDQLLQGGWSNSFVDVIRDCALYPAGFMSGPDYLPRKRYHWSGGKLVLKVDHSPSYRRIDPALAFPSSDALSARNGEFFIELKPVKLHDLIAWRDIDGYRRQAIDEILAEHKGEPPYDWLTSAMKANNVNMGVHQMLMPNQCHHVIVHQGMCSGRELNDYGITGLDPHELYEAHVEVFERRVIKARLLIETSGERTYYSTSWKKSPDSVWGVSVGMTIRDAELQVQALIAAAMQAADKSRGPVLEVTGSAFGTYQELEARGIDPYMFFKGDRPMGSNATQQRAITPHNIGGPFAQLWQVALQRLKLADEEVGLYGLWAGNPQVYGAGKTLGGFAMLMNAQQKPVFDYVQNLDGDIVEPLMQTQVVYNLQFHPRRKEIAADAYTKARGSTGALSRETQQAEMGQTLQIAMAARQQQLMRDSEVQQMLRDYLIAKGVPPDQLPDPRADAELLALSQGPNVTGGIPQLDGRSAPAQAAIESEVL